MVEIRLAVDDYNPLTGLEYRGYYLIGSARLSELVTKDTYTALERSSLLSKLVNFASKLYADHNRVAEILATCTEEYMEKCYNTAKENPNSIWGDEPPEQKVGYAYSRWQSCKADRLANERLRKKWEEEILADGHEERVIKIVPGRASSMR